MSLFGAIVLLIISVSALILGLAGIIAIVARGRSDPPASGKKDPVDKYMDDNYADVDWLRNGKL